MKKIKVRHVHVLTIHGECNHYIPQRCNNKNKNLTKEKFFFFEIICPNSFIWPSLCLFLIPQSPKLLTHALPSIFKIPIGFDLWPFLLPSPPLSTRWCLSVAALICLKKLPKDSSLLFVKISLFLLCYLFYVDTGFIVRWTSFYWVCSIRYTVRFNALPHQRDSTEWQFFSSSLDWLIEMEFTYAFETSTGMVKIAWGLFPHENHPPIS